MPPPTDRPLANADFVYPPYSVDQEYVAWFAGTVRTWRQFHDSQARLSRRWEQYASRRLAALRPSAGKCVVLRGVQGNWGLREVMVHSLRWVDTENPPREPVTLGRTQALPENLHPCGVWGDLLESPTEREGMRAPPEWPPPDLERLGSPASAGLVLPAVRGPAGSPAAATSSAVETRSKRARGVEALPAPRKKEPTEAATIYNKYFATRSF